MDCDDIAVEIHHNIIVMADLPTESSSFTESDTQHSGHSGGGSGCKPSKSCKQGCGYGRTRILSGWASFFLFFLGYVFVFAMATFIALRSPVNCVSYWSGALLTFLLYMLLLIIVARFLVC